MEIGKLYPELNSIIMFLCSNMREYILLGPIGYTFTNQESNKETLNTE